MKNLGKKLNIIIVNFNGGDFLLECLISLEKVSSELSFDISVVDNASSDGSLEKAQEKSARWRTKINYIKNKENLGFGRANNVALKKVLSSSSKNKTEYVLLLNPDSEVLPGTLSYMVKYMEAHPNDGVVTCRVEKEDGSIDLASHRGFPTPWASFLYFILGDDSLYHLTNQQMDRPHEVDAVAGAFFLARKSVLDQVGLFDEDYFLYGEDLDLCFRVKQAGYKIMYVPDVKIIHHKGISSGLKKHSQAVSTATEQSRKKALDSFYQTMKIFYEKHLEEKYPFFISWLVYLGIDLKWWLAKRRMVV